MRLASAWNAKFSEICNSNKAAHKRKTCEAEQEGAFDGRRQKISAPLTGKSA
jgi:hypothetical protein